MILITFYAKYKYYYNNIIQRVEILSQDINSKHDNDQGNILCDFCGNVIEACMCVCPYCGIRDKCECCLHDAATGG